MRVVGVAIHHPAADVPPAAAAHLAGGGSRVGVWSVRCSRAGDMGEGAAGLPGMGLARPSTPAAAWRLWRQPAGRPRAQRRACMQEGAAHHAPRHAGVRLAADERVLHLAAASRVRRYQCDRCGRCGVRGTKGRSDDAVRGAARQQEPCGFLAHAWDPPAEVAGLPPEVGIQLLRRALPLQPPRRLLLLRSGWKRAGGGAGGGWWGQGLCKSAGAPQQGTWAQTQEKERTAQLTLTASFRALRSSALSPRLDMMRS